VVTALFADLAGSTALGELLDPEEVKLVVGEAVARIVQVVESLGGTVKDLAGDGVLALFGAPVTHEDDAHRAVLTGLRIVREMRDYARDVERSWGLEGFGVRVGVATGPVVLGQIGAGRRVEYAAFGDTVNTAARLQAAAATNTVLVGDVTRRMVEAAFEWSDRREIGAKGKAEPVVAVEARAALDVTAKRRGPSGILTPLIGRDDELNLAREALDRVLSGSGGILFVSGEAGIGKSRLLAELRELTENASSEPRPLWLEGRCVSYGESLPYWPFRDLIRDWLGAGPDEPELRVRVSLRRAVDRLFPERSMAIYPYLGSLLGVSVEADAAARLSELSPEALQYRTFEVVRHLFERLAVDRPVVVAVDDLHWADPTSIQLVERLLPLTESAAVLLVIAGRPERDHPWWAVKELASREFPHRTRDIALEGLSGDSQRGLLGALVGENTLPAELERRLLDHAEGNPFYLEELIPSLVDAGALVR